MNTLGLNEYACNWCFADKANLNKKVGPTFTITIGDVNPLFRGLFRGWPKLKKPVGDKVPVGYGLPQHDVTYLKLSCYLAKYCPGSVGEEFFASRGIQDDNWLVSIGYICYKVPEADLPLTCELEFE